jgi:thiol-disulfide isomerase/thioredoxin
MDRLSIVIRAGLLLVTAAALACKSGAEKQAPPPPGRVVAVKAKKNDGETPAAFCDIQNAGPLTLPPIDGLATDGHKGPLWINLWATWCKPCIEEMPMIAGWEKRLSSTDKPLETLFVSVDEDAETLSRFLASRPAFPRSLRLTDPDTLPGWLKSLKLDEGAGLPIHILVSSDRTVRCVRAGAIKPDHFNIISTLLK